MKISRVKQQYIPTCKNYIKKQAIVAENDIHSSVNYYKNNFKNGWEIGSRVARLKGENAASAFLTKVYASLSKTKVRQGDIPAILGGIGLVVPVPAACIGGYAVGKIINKLVKIIKK